jgi:serine/threonine protein kinase
MSEVSELDAYPPLGKQLGEGSFGIVYEMSGKSDQIVKVFPQRIIEEHGVKALVSEVTIQQKLAEKLPGTCPKIFSFGKVRNDSLNEIDYIIVMERCVGTARTHLRANGKNDEVVLDYLEQVANILKRAKKFDFNHRDLKSDNIMYKLGDDKKKVYLLIDFGFSCATFDGVKYAGSTYYEPTRKCFRESRDLAMTVFELLWVQSLSPSMKKFIQLVLTFEYTDRYTNKKNICDMTKGCDELDFYGGWEELYDFLDDDTIENPNTTPDGLLNAIKAYRERGIASCEKDGFILNPIKGECMPDPGAPRPVKGEPKSPGKHLASPLYVSPPEAEAGPSPAVEPGAKWSGGKKKRRAYSGVCTRRRAPGARARRKTLRHKRGIRK